MTDEASAASAPVPTPFVRIEDFLTDEEHKSVLSFVAEHRGLYEPASVHARPDRAPRTGPDESVRRSAVAFQLDELWPIFEQRLESLLPAVRGELGVEWFPRGRVEHQLTTHRDGDFFALHSDTGGSLRDPRRVSYVYYFNFEPKQFEGGALRLYDKVDIDGVTQPAESWVTIEPIDNSIVFFPSNAYHEVEPVRGTGEGPGAERHTLNGWFRTTDDFVAGLRVAHGFDVDPQTMADIQRRYLPTYTATGFDVRATPPEIHRVLQAVHDLRHEDAVPERAEPLFLPTGRPELVYIEDIKRDIIERLRPVHEEWSGQKLEPTAAYGIRVYRDGQTLVMHTDRPATHAVSSVVHIDHDQDQPWPLTIVAHDGEAHDVVLEPGQMLLYESAVCLHGRPTPFRGRSFASVFLHYRPVDGWDYTRRDLLTWALADGVV